VVDVGAEYLPDKLRLDHHQKSFKEYWSEHYKGIKLSSAGLVYRHYGKEIVHNICKEIWNTNLNE